MRKGKGDPRSLPFLPDARCYAEPVYDGPVHDGDTNDNKQVDPPCQPPEDYVRYDEDEEQQENHCGIMGDDVQNRVPSPCGHFGDWP